MQILKSKPFGNKKKWEFDRKLRAKNIFHAQYIYAAFSVNNEYNNLRN